MCLEHPHLNLQHFPGHNWLNCTVHGHNLESPDANSQHPEFFFVLAGKGQCGVLLFQENPVDPSMNEHYLWHGCKPEGAEGITDANFDLKRDSVRSWAVP